MTDKIQIGKDVWIRPNTKAKIPEEDDMYFSVNNQGLVEIDYWYGSSIDFALYGCGNCFTTREDAEAAIIKPVNSTPITYRQWQLHGRPSVYTVDTLGCVCELVFTLPPHVVFFDSCNCWFTYEAAQAWIDEWYDDAGVTK